MPLGRAWNNIQDDPLRPPVYPLRHRSDDGAPSSGTGGMWRWGQPGKALKPLYLSRTG